MRLFRRVLDLPTGIKLAATVVGALSLLSGVSWFALDRLDFVTALQAGVAQQAELGYQVQQSLIAAEELRVVSREIQSQQTAAGIKSALQRAAQQKDTAEALLGSLGDKTALEALMAAVQRAADLRQDMLALRQKRLFQVRATFDTSLNTLTAEVARGAALASGVDSVRSSGDTVQADQRDPTIEALARYRLGMSRLAQAALMFMATGNGSAANEVRDATAEQEAAMAAVLSGPAPEAIKRDARIVDAIGKGIAATSIELIAMARKLDQVAGADVESASQAMRAALNAVVAAAVEREHAAVAAARDAGAEATRDLMAIIGVIAVLMAVSGAVVTRMIAGPIRRLTTAVQAIAAGRTELDVPFATRRDEVGQMAASVETLRDVMRETFIQGQVIEQLPVGVMTAEPSGDFRITYMNAEVRNILKTVKDHVPVPLDRLLGQSMDVFHPDPKTQRDLVSNPANLPHQMRISLGGETIDLRVSAIMDRQGGYAGPLLTWRSMSAQARLVDQFDQSVGAIAHAVAASAGGMQRAATEMRQSTVDAGQRTLAVSAAFDQASHSVSTAAAGAEQVAVSVSEIARQVAESARIAAKGVAEAEATDASVVGLNKAVERIGAVINLIREIAGRTNLLALNATIEAARAGEAGKGFAVVAGEVKSLATQTAKATEEIGGQIAAMQTATAAAVTALRSIGATIQQMNEIATTIAESVEQQGAATQSIAQAVQHAAAGTAEVNSNIAAVTQVVEETSDRAGIVLDAATGMSKQASVLQEEVAKFLVAVQRAA